MIWGGADRVDEGLAGKTMNVPSKGAVCAGAANPTGAAFCRFVIGIETVPPAYFPDTTGPPKKFCAS